MKEKQYHEQVIDEIVEMIRNNIELYYNNSTEYFGGLRDFCKSNDNNKRNLNYNQLLFLVEEALSELINCTYLYDFRTLE